MQKHDRTGKAEADSKGGTQEAKGGEAGVKINRDDVVQAALIIERWCREHRELEMCDCPFAGYERCVIHEGLAIPKYWGLENWLSTRGLKR